MSQISLDDAFSMVAAGGWHLRVKGVVGGPVTGAEIAGDVVMFRNDTLSVGGVNIDRLTVEAWGGKRPDQLVFVGPHMVRQQRKKADGGGWHEVEGFGALITLVNPTLKAEHEAAKVERRKCEEQEQRKFERLEQERTAAVYSRHLVEFVTRQKERLQGAVFEDLRIHEDVVTITFVGGLEFQVALHDREDPYDVHTDASFGITIGGEPL